MPVEGGTAPDKGREGKWKQRLSNLIQDWKGIRNRIEDLLETIDQEQRTGYDDATLNRLQGELTDLRDDRRHMVNQIRDIASARGLEDYAVEQGFRQDLLKPGEGNTDTPAAAEGSGRVPGVGSREGEGAGGGGGKVSGSTGRGGGGRRSGGGSGGGLGSRERLKNFKLVRLPSGRVAAIRTLNIGGNKVQWGVWVDKADFDKYGVNEKDIRPLQTTAGKKLEIVGNADELVFRGDDKNEFKAIIRGVTRAHKGSPILEDDELLGIIVAQSALGLTDSETQGLLKKTKWYQKSTEHEQIWTLDYSKEKRTEDIRNMKVRLVDELEDLYGMEWQKHLGKNAMKQVRDWAEQIASGELGGDPSSGLDRWLRRQFDQAADIEGTPAWMQRQSEEEEAAKFANRPEEVFERLRSEAMAYLGYDKNNTPRIDRGSLKQWAADLVSGNQSEGDWAQFLRTQMKTLHPYFDANLSFTEQASPYKSIAERTLGDTLDWNDRLLRDFTRLDASGNPTDKPMSLHDYELKVRQDKRAWREGTALWDEGLGIVQGLEAIFKGVG